MCNDQSPGVGKKTKKAIIRDINASVTKTSNECGGASLAIHNKKLFRFERVNIRGIPR